MKKVFNIIGSVLTWALVILAVVVMVFTIISVTTFDRADRSLFGYRAFIVLSDSMSATDFDAGDVVLVKDVDSNTLAPGDIIAFYSQSPANFGDVVTHKIRSITVDSSGNPAFVTYGTTTGTDDDTPTPYLSVIGKYSRRLPHVGSFFTYLKTTPGYICCILIPFLLLIGIQGINCIRLFKAYKAEQVAEMQAERQKLEEERAEAQRMLSELTALKKQLGMDSQAEDTAPDKTDM